METRGGQGEKKIGEDREGRKLKLHARLAPCVLLQRGLSILGAFFSVFVFALKYDVHSFKKPIC